MRSAEQMSQELAAGMPAKVQEAVAAGRATPEQGQKFLADWQDLMQNGERHTGTKRSLILFATTALGGYGLQALAGAGAATPSVAGSAFGAPPGAIGGLGGIGSGVSAGTAGITGAAAPTAVGAGGKLGSIIGTAKRLAPILGDMAGSRADAQQQNDVMGLANANFDLKAPGERLATGAKANKILHGSPVKAEWGGPGSGLKGQQVNYTGGYNNPELYNDPQMHDLAQQTMEEELRQSKAGPRPKAGKSSLLDNILGYGAQAAGIAGALRK